jgi:hypothetical protein
MTALANGSNATPAQGDVDDALASPMVRDEAASNPELAPDSVEADYRRERAEAKAAALDQARQMAVATDDWSAFEALRTAQDRDDSDVPHAERGLHVDICREPWLLHGLPVRRGWLSPDAAATYEHRLEVSDAVYKAGAPGASGRLLFPGFTTMDREDVTSWRPWNVDLLTMPPTEEGVFASQRLTAMAKQERFQAVLGKIADQHTERHWFYVHPFCGECFPADVLTVDCYYASWLLRQTSETRFPAEDWDGQVPPLPVIPDEVDFMSADDLAALPEPGWLIQDVLPDSGTGVLRARDQSFKSFMALDMSLQVAFGKYGKVLYCVGEGANNFGHRIDAWLEHNEEVFDEAIPGPTLLPAVPNLFTGGDLYDRVLARARTERYDLIVIDTYARATAGSDLNNQGDQAVVTARIDELRRATGGTVLLVAHSQKSDLDSSGSIEIEDARDFVFSMKRNGSEVTFEVAKQKDGVESTRPIRYVAKPVGQSIVLVGAGESRDQPLMGTKEWIIAALDNTRGLGPQSEAEIRQWINTHPDYLRLGNKALTKSTSSSTLSRLVEAGTVAKGGPRYSLPAASIEESS